MGMIPNNTFASETELQHDQLRVNFTRDGLDLTPAEYSSILSQLADEGKIKADKYSRFGIVEELESKFATLLDKESAIPQGLLRPIQNPLSQENGLVFVPIKRGPNRWCR